MSEIQTNPVPTDTPRPAAIDGKTFAIGILSVTACVLFVGFLLVTLTPSRAYAIGQSDRSGDYIMLTQQVTNSTEVLVVIDAAIKRLNLYVLDTSRHEIRLLQSNVPLDQLPGSIEQETNNRGG